MSRRDKWRKRKYNISNGMAIAHMRANLPRPLACCFITTQRIFPPNFNVVGPTQAEKAGLEHAAELSGITQIAVEAWKKENVATTGIEPVIRIPHGILHGV